MLEPAFDMTARLLLRRQGFTVVQIKLLEARLQSAKDSKSGSEDGGVSVQTIAAWYPACM